MKNKRDYQMALDNLFAGDYTEDEYYYYTNGEILKEDIETLRGLIDHLPGTFFRKINEKEAVKNVSIRTGMPLVNRSYNTRGELVEYLFGDAKLGSFMIRKNGFPKKTYYTKDYARKLDIKDLREVIRKIQAIIELMEVMEDDNNKAN